MVAARFGDRAQRAATKGSGQSIQAAEPALKGARFPVRWRPPYRFAMVDVSGHP
jgi:hypothetical protein